MGGDGGSIPKRADVVRTAGYKFVRNLGGMGYVPNTQVRMASEKLTQNEERELKLRTCFLTQEPLKNPIVIDRLGQLYNKETLLSRLLCRKKSPLPSALAHLRGLSDLRELSVSIDPEKNFLICPITKARITSGTRAVVMWTCGCVSTLKAFEITQGGSKAVKKPHFVCMQCGQPCSYDDIIPLAPSGRELDDLRSKLEKTPARERGRGGLSSAHTVVRKRKAEKSSPAHTAKKYQTDSLATHGNDK